MKSAQLVVEFNAAAGLSPARLSIALVQLALGGAMLCAVLSFAVRGVLPSSAASVLVPLAFLGAVVALRNTSLAARGTQERARLLRQHGFWIAVLLCLLVLPGLGSFGLIDPWETHYAEVAREMLARRDPISMWWAHQGWFMSKPVLTPWLEALAMGALGAKFLPGEVLDGLGRPEWAVRLPGALFALGGCFTLYRGVAAHAGRTAGFFTASCSRALLSGHSLRVTR